MKKFLCYVAIFLLILVIAIPPLTRIFYKEKQEEEVVRDIYTLVTCTKDSYIINESYKNDEALSIKFTRSLLDDKLNEYSDDYAIEFTLDNELKNLTTTNEDNENEKISYLLEFRKVDSSKLEKLANYRLSLDEQIKYYEQDDYACKKMVQ